MSLRGVFFDEDDARGVAARLVRDGFDARVVRERFAGEDDDEDQPWAVLTDAPAVMLEILVEERDGWLEDDEPGDPRHGRGPSSRAPLALPTQPRRSRRGPEGGHGEGSPERP